MTYVAEFTFLKKKNIAKEFMILKSIKYDIGLKYTEYLPCLNVFTYFFMCLEKSLCSLL